MAAQIEQLLLMENDKLRMLGLLDAEPACRAHPLSGGAHEVHARQSAHGGGGEAGRRVNAARVRLAPISPASPGALDAEDLCVRSAPLIKAAGTSSPCASRDFSGLGQLHEGYPLTAKSPSSMPFGASAARRRPTGPNTESPSYTPPLSPADLVGLGAGLKQSAPGQAQASRGAFGTGHVASSARMNQKVCRLLASLLFADLFWRVGIARQLKCHRVCAASCSPFLFNHLLAAHGHARAATCMAPRRNSPNALRHAMRVLYGQVYYQQMAISLLCLGGGGMGITR